MEPGTVLVEGESDRGAVVALARLRGLDPATYSVVAMGGVTNVRRHLLEVTAREDGALGPLVAGLCDAGEVDVVVRGLAAAGLGPRRGGLDRWDLEGLGFFVCESDLEDELIRALGTDRVLEVVDRQRDSGSFHSLTTQPAHRDRTTAQQLHRFLGSGSGRKIRYAPLLVEALPEGAVPPPLAALVDHVARWGG